MGMTRRDLLGSALSFAALPTRAEGGDGKSGDAPLWWYSPQVPHDAPPRNRHPYKGVDWTKCRRIVTTSHGHCTNASMLSHYLRHGFGLMTMSNYYPSAPYVPAAKMRENQYRVHHDHPVIKDGKIYRGPFDWNGLVARWKDKLDPKFAKQHPFKEGALCFPNWPKGMLEAPNAEHHAFYHNDGKIDWYLHLCAPGSNYRSGYFDAHCDFQTWRAGFKLGCHENWRTSVDRMIAALVYPDGGGVTINHPSWSKLDRNLMLRLLDHDPRVLGCEVLEEGYNSENYWDWVLATGRQCFGFFVPDWGFAKKDFGANVLIVPEASVHACMKAYRQGDFYGTLHAMDELRFTRIAFDGKTVSASTDKLARFQVITARGIVHEGQGVDVRWTVPEDGSRQGRELEVFVRIKAFATDGSGEILWTQPFMLVEECVRSEKR